MPPTRCDLPDPLYPRSQSFVLRAWREDMGNDQHEWRAFVCHVLSGETRFIRTWQELEAFLEAFEERKPEKTPTPANGTG
jgi:hypothetical protein